ncbi:MAG: hydrogenase maturation protease [Nitrospirales bacterium]|nr:hydrogenase maturation protease [Nitrospirales bacterium]
MENNTIIRVIGIGNPLAGDDAVGSHIVRNLVKYRISGVEFVDAGLVGLELLDLLEGVKKVIIIDAFRSGGDPGEVVRLVLPEDLEQISAFAWESVMPSTHSIGIGEALTMGNILGILPPYLTIFGIELGQTEMGRGLSRNIYPAIESVTSQILLELEQWTCMNSM